jgi:hypothetical protein
MKFNYTPRQNTKHILVLDGQELSEGTVELPDNYADYGIFVSMLANAELTPVEAPKVIAVITPDIVEAKTRRRRAVIANAE